MVYWIENIENGSFIEGAKSYEEALTIQDKKFNEGIDTYIRKD